MQRNRHNGPSIKGFTIVETVIVLLIVGILAAIAVPAYNNYIDRSLVKLAIRQVKLIEHAIKAFELENMRQPNSLSDLPPIDLPDEKGNSTRQSPPFRDPWGNTYRFLNLANDSPPAYPNARRDRNNKPLSLDYDLYSMGADGQTGKQVTHGFGADDIVRANTGAFIGLGVEY